VQIGHWFGLAHTWAQTAESRQEGCQASADYKNIVTVKDGDSGGVRDTPPQATGADGQPIFFDCAGTTPSPLQSCSSGLDFPQGDTYYANFANVMVSVSECQSQQASGIAVAAIPDRSDVADSAC
jgi:hypothetical protein